MKPCARLLQRFSNLSHHPNIPSFYLSNQCRTILQFANNNSSNNNKNAMDNEGPVRLSTQYPPPPLEERYNKPIAKSGAKIEPYRDVQFKPKDPSDKDKQPTSGQIPLDLQENNVVDKQYNKSSSPEDELCLGGHVIDPLEFKKMIPHGTASKEEIENAINEEAAEWKGVHFSERQYTAKLGDIVNRQRPKEITRLMESSKPPLHKPGRRSIQPVEAGGPAYPIFYDPKEGMNRPQANLPRDIDGRKARVTHIASLQKATGISHSECALEYDYAHGQYSIALERLRDKQVTHLEQLTSKSRQECKKEFDKCLGNFDKALRKLRR